VRDRVVEAATQGVETGGIVRCCSPRTGWGSATLSELDRVDSTVRQAHEFSLATASGVPVVLAPIAIRQSGPTSPPTDDPRDIPLPECRQRGESLAAALFATDRRIGAARILLRSEVTDTWLATSEGTWLHDQRPDVSLSVLAVGSEDGNVERALGSFAARGGWRALSGAQGLITATSLRVMERLHAPPVRPGRYTVVLDPAAAGALVHRAVAHCARPSLPGADPDVLPMGTRVGPEFLTMGDDPTTVGLRASALIDDEGTVARRTTLIQNGVVVGHLHSRETAAASGQAPTGHARAGTLRGAPFPRASNSYLAQGEGDLPDLLTGIGIGVYVSDVLACEAVNDQVTLRAGAARMIRQGRLAEPVKGVEISASLLSLLGRVDAIAGDFSWDPGNARCEDGAAGIVPITTGAPHLRLVDIGIGEGIS